MASFSNITGKVPTLLTSIVCFLNESLLSNINTGSCLGNITISPYHIKLNNLYFII